MRSTFFVLTCVTTFLLLQANAQPLRVVPTTTLQAETANNTSANAGFRYMTNGDAAAGNISKLPIRDLLYPGAQTKIYAHFVAWFGHGGHMDVGYASDDPAQVRRQIDDMVSRGIDGVIMDWYGSDPSNIAFRTTSYVMQEAERHPGFTFAIMVDKGAFRGCGKGCDATSALIHELQYAARNYFTSPAYLRLEGRPVITSFDLDRRYHIDWRKVVAKAPGNPLFLFDNGNGFDHAFSGGSYVWIGVNKSDHNDWGRGYLDGFYTAALRRGNEHAFGSVKPGFNDRFANWGQGRVMNRNCGQVWLATFDEVGRFYSVRKQLESLQIITWNDYEEGTEIETGVENCVAVSGRVDGGELEWNVSGKENTLHYYQVFISTDGQNLMPLAKVPVGVHEIDLRCYRLAPGRYVFYVKAVGLPSIKNHISNAVEYVVPGAALVSTQSRGVEP